MDLDRIYALAKRVKQRLHCSQQIAVALSILVTGAFAQNTVANTLIACSAWSLLGILTVAAPLCPAPRSS
jgi:hypothetical protein